MSFHCICSFQIINHSYRLICTSASSGSLLPLSVASLNLPKGETSASVHISFTIQLINCASSPPPSGELEGAFYSYLSASTGFLVAAFQLCQLTVSRAIPNASKPAKANIHQLKLVL